MLMLLVAPLGAHATNVDKTNKSIVWVDVEFNGTVVVPFKDGTTESYTEDVLFLCTGFFVSKDAHVATAGHCLEKSSAVRVALISKVIEAQELKVGLKPSELNWDVSIEEPEVYVGQPDIPNGGPLAGKESVLARVVDFQPFENGDSALLQISNMTVTDYLSIATVKPKVEDKVTSVGFPGSVDSVTDVKRQQATFTSGTVSAPSTTKKGVPVTQINAAVSRGMSGGPTLNANDEVVGVNSFGVVGETQPFNFVTDTEILRDFLSDNGVELVAASAPSATGVAVPNNAGAGVASAPADAGSSVPVWLWVIIGLLALIVLVMVLALRRVMARQSSGTTPPANTL